VQETARQHRVLVEAIVGRDIEAADRIAVEHQELSFSRLKRALFSGAVSITSMPSLAIKKGMFSLA
jgi:DNA-binding GntR family transcriptional regulator